MLSTGRSYRQSSSAFVPDTAAKDNDAGRGAAAVGKGAVMGFIEAFEHSWDDFAQQFPEWWSENPLLAIMNAAFIPLMVPLYAVLLMLGVREF